MSNNQSQLMTNLLGGLILLLLGTVGSAAGYLFVWNSKLQSAVDVLRADAARNTVIIERLQERKP